MKKTLLISGVFLLLSCGVEEKKISSSIIDAEALAIDPPPPLSQKNTFPKESSNQIAVEEIKLVALSENSSGAKNQPKKKQNKRKKTISSKKSLKSTNHKSNLSMYCGAQNKTGGNCRRKVRGGGRCWQH